MSRFPPAFLLVAIFCVFGACIRVADLSLPRKLSADEGIYTGQAINMVKLGPVNGNRATSQRYLHNAELAKYPPPTRLGFVLPVALTMWLTGSRTEDVGAWVSCAASIASLALATVIGLDFFGQWPTVFGLAFLSVFPPDLLVANRCWTDSLVGLAGAATIYLSCRVLAERAIKPAYLAMLLSVGTLSLLIKETCVLFYGPCLVTVLCVALRRKYPQRALLLLIGGAFLGAVIDVGIWTVMTGRPGLFIDLIRMGQSAHVVNPYTLQFQSGPPQLLLRVFWGLSPCVVTLGFLGVMLAVLPEQWSREKSVRKLRVLAAGIVALMLLFACLPLSLNVRYLSPIYPLICLFGGFGIVSALSAAQKLLPQIGYKGLSFASLLLLTMLLGRDWLRVSNYVRAGITDGSVGVVLAFDHSTKQ